MKLIISTLGITLSVFAIAQADMLTGQSVTDRYITGKLDTRIEELGTNKASGEKMPQWKQTIKDGVARHCRFTLVARGVKDTSSCTR